MGNIKKIRKPKAKGLKIKDQICKTVLYLKDLRAFRRKKQHV